MQAPKTFIEVPATEPPKREGYYPVVLDYGNEERIIGVRYFDGQNFIVVGDGNGLFPVLSYLVRIK